jgi:cytochrome b561
MNDMRDATTARPIPLTRAVWTRTAIALHWLMALLMIGSFGIGWVMTDIHGLTPMKLRYYAWHKWIGVTVFALALLRVLWRATHRAPPSPAMPAWQRRIAQGVHALLYLLMFAAPLSGYLFSSAANVPVVYLGIVRLPMLIGPSELWKTIWRDTHVVLVYTLAVLVVVHVAAALKHQWIDRDGLLSRMLPFSSRSSGR